jgi:Protein kinase domain
VTDRDAPFPGLEELLQLNLEGELHRLPYERGMVIAGKWTLTRRLGAGGFGQVWEAWHVELQKKQAIKFLDGEHRDPAAARARFLAEAQLLATLDSKHLVRVLDYGELPDDVPYFVMELVQGPTLRQRLTEPLAVARAVEITEQLLEALSDVHARGLTHGDVKPENIILSGPEEQVRVLDFGLARITAHATGVAGGTPPYMAPELVLDGKPSSPRSDVYAVGVVLYELLTGELPCGHASMGLEEIQQSWTKKPTVTPMRVLRKQVPAALDELVMKALSRDPSLRFEAAGEMHETLRVLGRKVASGLANTVESAARPPASVMAETEPMRPEPTANERWRWIAVAVVLGVAALLVGLGWYLWPEDKEGESHAAKLASAAKPWVPPPFDAKTFAAAKDGIVVVAAEGAPAAVVSTYDTLCTALRGDPPSGKGLLCTRLPVAAIDADAIVRAADEAGARSVMLVGKQIVVRFTSHNRGSPVVARVDGLPLPKESALRDVAIVLRALVDPSGSRQVEIPVLALREWDPRWVVFAEWLRARRGQHDDPDDEARLAELRHALDEQREAARNRGEIIPVFYRDMAELLWAQRTTCPIGMTALKQLSAPGVHERGIQIAALLGLAACSVEGEVRLDQADAAEALVEQALAASGGNPCVRMSALGTLSRIDLWRGNDALWRKHTVGQPGEDVCDEPFTWSTVLSVRGDALVAAKRWCEAAETHEQAYGAMATRADPLLAWAETSWACKPDRKTDRTELLAALQRGRESLRFAAVVRASIAYMRWWLTNDPVDAQHVLTRYADVELGKPALLEGVGSDLEREICSGTHDPDCSLTILASPKQPGDEDRLRAALGLRR